MQISIFGLGYVGAVTAACLAELGHEVIGVDVNPDKVQMINAGRAPVIEPGLRELIAAGTGAKRLRATTDPTEAVHGSQISLVCVGTPTTEADGVSLEALQNVVTQIGAALQTKRGPHAVVVRSTVLPGTTMDRVAPVLRSISGRRIGEGLALCFNPEFLREGSAIRDFHHPPFTVIGSPEGTSPPAIEEIYGNTTTPVFRTSCGVAEAVKYVCNAFHALKIAFANEIGSVFKEKGIDGREVMRLFCEDRQLNLSEAYLRPGFAFGGSCLPKDVQALNHFARTANVSTPVLDHLLVSNEAHIDRAFRIIAAKGRRTVALFGLSFKPDTDDLRNSPYVSLAERLIGRGYPLRIFDQCLELSRLIGTNREFIDREIPHLENLMASSPEAALDGAGVIVIGHAGQAEIDAIAKHHGGRQIIDLRGIELLKSLKDSTYSGICW